MIPKRWTADEYAAMLARLEAMYTRAHGPHPLVSETIMWQDAARHWLPDIFELARAALASAPPPPEENKAEKKSSRVYVRPEDTTL